MVERDAGPMITIFLAQDFARGAALELPESASQHVRVRRAAVGDQIRLVDGRGNVAAASLTAIGKRTVSAQVDSVETHERPGALVAVVPVADRERMLWAAEKCVELGITRWQPVLFDRSRSVSPRGEGEKFQDKLRARMQSALEQSGGTWLPEINREIGAADAWESAQAPNRLILLHDGAPAVTAVGSGAVVFAVGPEGGFERTEVEDALRHGWKPVSLGPTTLRFETAIVAAAAVARAMQLTGGDRR